MKHLRILMVISSFRPLVGGGETQAERLALSFTAQGHQVTVLTRRADPSWSAHEVLGDVQIVRVGGTNRWGVTFAKLFWIAKHWREFDVIHAHQSTSPLVAAAIAHRFWRLPVVCTPFTYQPELGWLNSGVANRMRRWLFRVTARWLALSREIADALEPFAPGSVDQVPNGVDTDMFRPSDRPPNAIPVVMSVCRQLLPKRIDTLLQAWAQLNVQARLVIVGDGPMRSTWEQLSWDLQLEDVTFLGQRDDVAELLRGADVFVLPSDREGMPNVLLEAMSSGLACIGSDVGAMPELLNGGVGITVPKASTADLAEALTTVLTNTEMREEMGRRARKRILDQFSLAAVTQNIETIYRYVLNEN